MYGKIYEQTFTGSMFGKGVQVFAVWSYVIANTKPDSLVELNPDMLAAMLGSTSDEIQKAIDFLCSPDPKSRSHMFEGRRLVEKGPFIYLVPNATKYRGLANDTTRRQYFAEKQREHRQRLKECQTVKSKMSSSVKQAEAISIKQKAEANLTEEKLGFLEQLKRDPFNAGVDIDAELEKAQRWCKKKGRRCTQRFFEKWVSRADRLVGETKPSKPKQIESEPPAPELSPEELEHRKLILSQQMKELREKFRMPV